MRTILVLVAAVTACAANTIPAEVQNILSKNPGYSRFVQFPDGRGNLHSVDLEAEVDEDIFGDERDGELNQYWLYTRDNPKNHQLLTMGDVESVEKSNFKPRNPTVVVVHGWLSDATIDPCPSTRDAMLQRGAMNVICVDWRNVAQRLYSTSMVGVIGVGKGAARMLDFIHSIYNNRVEGSFSYNHVHLVGLSLGAHTVGHIGRSLRDNAGRPLIGRITALDPAGPGFSVNLDRCFRKDDGRFTEIINTDNILGMSADVGHVNIYMNGGSNMPGCSTPVCSHMIATDYFCATILYEHIFGYECSSSLEMMLNRCTGPRHQVGTHHMNNKRESGRFRANTASSYPF